MWALVLGVVVGVGAIALYRTVQPSLPASVEDIRRSGELVVLTTEGPTIYQEGEDGPQGYEVDLVGSFAESLGVTARFVVVDDVASVFEAIAAGRGHLAAANLTVTDTRRSQYEFGPAYLNVAEQLVCHRKSRLARDLGGLDTAEIAVVAGASYEDTLSGLQDDRPEVTWQAVPTGSAMPLLARIAEGDIDCTVADSHLVAHARRHFPELAVPADLTEERPLAWSINPRTRGLADRLEAWFETAHERGVLRELDERWFGHLRDFDYVDQARFRRRIDSRLPRYRDLFKQAAKGRPFDWRLLAAQSYQESHWDPRAKSPTGVRGLMMLTLPTAREMGVTRRLDPKQSVRGGAAYLQLLYDRLPDTVTGDDRLWLALAAYNVGYGHLRDAKELARREGLDPDRWSDVAEMLPRLSDPEYYKTLRFGYARGREPVAYVRNIREYEQVLHAVLDGRASTPSEPAP